MTATEIPALQPAEVDGLLAELLMTPEGRRDPYGRYAQIQQLAPVHASSLGFTVCSRYDDCQLVLRDPRLGKEGDRVERTIATSREVAAALAQLRGRPASMLMLNPPDHTRMRGLVSKAFTPRTVERLRPHIVRLLDDLLDSIDTAPGAAPTDVMTAVALPLPVTVIGEMLGIPPADRPPFQSWVRSTTALLELAPTIEEVLAAAEADRHMGAYFVELLAERRRHPTADLLSGLLAVEDGGDTLSEGELISTAILLFGAGFETTSNLIGNGLLALLGHPDQLHRLRGDRTLVRSAVEELLRFDSPVQLDGRTAFEDVEIAGWRVPAGAMVVTMLGAANRDPSHFPDPGRLDIGRQDGPPISFGSGIHYCLGAALARLEGEIFFDRLLERFGTIELATDTVDYRSSLTLRGLAALPVRFAVAS